MASLLSNLLGSALRNLYLIVSIRSAEHGVTGRWYSDFCLTSDLTHRDPDKTATADFADIFKLIFLNEIVRIFTLISLNFYPKGPTDTNSSLGQIMAWCQTSNKPLFEPRVAYCQTSNISHTSVGNKIVDHSDVVRALPIGTAPTTSSF